MSAVSIPRSSRLQPWRCPLCHCFAAPGPKGILRHMGTIHAMDSNFHVICGLQWCPRSYNNYHSYKKHMYKKHRDVLELDYSSCSQPDGSNPSLEYGNFDRDDDDDMSNPPPVMSVKDEKKTSALFLLKTTAVTKVSKSALDDLVSDFSIFLNSKLHTLENDVTTYLRQKNVEVDSDLLKMFRSPSVTSPFQGLDSEYLRKKYYIDHLGMLVSMCMCTCMCFMLAASMPGYKCMLAKFSLAYWQWLCMCYPFDHGTYVHVYTFVGRKLILHISWVHLEPVFIAVGTRWTQTWSKDCWNKRTTSHSIQEDYIYIWDSIDFLVETVSIWPFYIGRSETYSCFYCIVLRSMYVCMLGIERSSAYW